MSTLPNINNNESQPFPKKNSSHLPSASPSKINSSIKKIKNNSKTIDIDSSPQKLRSNSPHKSINNDDDSFSKKYRVYKNDCFIFEPYSSNRAVTIPNKKDRFGYSIRTDGDLELISDPDMDKKFNGTKRSSVGPGHYDITVEHRKRNVINWKLGPEKENGEKPNKIRVTKTNQELEDLYIKNRPRYENYLNSNYINNNVLVNKSVDRIKNYLDRRDFKINMFNDKIYKNTNLGLKSTENLDYIDLTSIPNKGFKEASVSPGPGAYYYSDEFIIEPKNNKYQNFGSSVSRGLENKKEIKPIDNNNSNETNNINNRYLRNCIYSNPNIHNYYKNNNNNINSNNSCDKLRLSFFADSESIVNDNPNIILTNRLKNILNLEKESINRNKRIIHDLKIDVLKNYNKVKKNDSISKLGPGSYNPVGKISPEHKTSPIQNFGSLEKRFFTVGKEDFPGAGSYIALDNWERKPFSVMLKSNENNEKENNYKLKIFGYKEPNYEPAKKREENAFFGEEGGNESTPGVGKYHPEYTKSIEYDTRVNVNKTKSIKRPGFGSNEPRFYIFRNQINKKNGVGKYDLMFKLKELKQGKVPFNNSAAKDNIKNIGVIQEFNTIVGPGSYRKDSYFDWNKKTFNSMYKNKNINMTNLNNSNAYINKSNNNNNST